MNNKFIIGRYIDTNSWIHKLDPRSKTIAMMLYVITIITSDSLYDVILISFVSFAIMLSTRIPLSTYLRAVRPLRFLILYIMIFHLLFTQSGQAVFTWGWIHITSNGLWKGLFAGWRMAMMISFTAMLTFTTTPNRLTQGLESVLYPLKLFRVSPERITLMLQIALRFIPTIFSETHRIIKAQASRGADLKELPWKAKGKMIISLLLPVTVSAFRRADDLVNSMESRGYELGATRSKYHTLSWSNNDSLLLMIFILLIALIIWL
ncbi:energy-coupling factor transporter transmembrane protein EcfT [Paenibacillus albiflavus]|uniref:Energy-coupling factor transporter transmembrane protein EcfT n=1 Tax=Paenibacillus albiflavus TaxID=2545760 RepID=A0A4R4E955_9BACL|nr:energy-coupling factor transporter transmembrane component T [Paenibacillus albiflavus]TCZ76356.1 energy-coupling factor transporter transmembrane protein EcfT [Paenibacillus albiflavus]